MASTDARTSVANSFLPEDYVRNKAENRSNFMSLVLFVIVLFGVVGAFFVTNQQWNSVKSQQQEVNRLYATETKKIDQLKGLEKQKGEMLDKAEITTALIEKVPRSILLAELINRMPEKMTIAELTITSKRIREDPPKKADPANKPKSLSAKPGEASKPAAAGKDEPPARPKPPKMEFALLISGFASTDTDVADYQAALKECPLLDRVDLVSTVDTKVDDINVRKFRLEAAIKTTADARSIEPMQVPRFHSAASVTQAPDHLAGSPDSPAAPTAPAGASIKFTGPASQPATNTRPAPAATQTPAKGVAGVSGGH